MWITAIVRFFYTPTVIFYSSAAIVNFDLLFLYDSEGYFLDLLQKISKLDFKPRCLRVKSETVKEEQTKLQTKHI